MKPTRRVFIKPAWWRCAALLRLSALAAKPRKSAEWTETFDVIVIGSDFQAFAAAVRVGKRREARNPARKRRGADRRLHGDQQRHHTRARQSAPEGQGHRGASPEAMLKDLLKAGKGRHPGADPHAVDHGVEAFSSSSSGTARSSLIRDAARRHDRVACSSRTTTARISPKGNRPTPTGRPGVMSAPKKRSVSVRTSLRDVAPGSGGRLAPQPPEACLFQPWRMKVPSSSSRKA